MQTGEFQIWQSLKSFWSYKSIKFLLSLSCAVYLWGKAKLRENKNVLYINELYNNIFIWSSKNVNGKISLMQ